MKKYLYLLVGIGVLIWAATITVWFYEEMVYLLTNPKAFTPQVRTLGVIVSWIFGAISLYLGIKNEKINKTSNASLITLIFVVISTFILSFFSCSVTGFDSMCPPYTVTAEKISGIILIYGTALGFLLMVISVFIKKKI